MAWVTLAELKQDIGITDTRDDLVLQTILDAAIDYVESVHPFGPEPVYDQAEWDNAYWDNAPVDPQIKLGTVRLAARWFARRASPSALIEMADAGSARVPSFDADIDRMLRIGRFRRAVFA